MEKVLVPNFLFFKFMHFFDILFLLFIFLILAFFFKFFFSLNSQKKFQVLFFRTKTF